MKKSLICLILLLVLSISSMAAASSLLVNTEPTLELKTVCGDPSVLDDLQLTMFYRQGDLLWKLEKIFGGGSKSETDILKEKSRMSEMEKDYWNCQNAIDGRENAGLYVDDMMYYYPEHEREPKRIYTEQGKSRIQAFYDRTEDGEDAKETVPYLDIHTEAFGIKLYTEEMITDQENKKLQDLERQLILGVTEAHDIPVSINILWEGSFRESCDLDVNSFSLISGDFLYLAFEFRDGNGLLLDYSRLPGGYGIYRVPLKQDHGAVLESFLPLEEDVRIEGLTHDFRADRLLVLLGGKNGKTLLQLNAKTGEIVQRITVPITRSVQLFRKQDSVVLLNNSGDLALLQRDGNEDYQLKYSHSGEQTGENYIRYNENMICLHGDNTIVLDYAVSEKTGFYIRVYDETGQIYSGEIIESLRIGEINGWMRPTPWRTVFGGMKPKEAAQ